MSGEKSKNEQTSNETTEHPDYEAVLTRYRDHARSIDLMPIDDDELQYHQRHSLFQDRRLAQMAFLQKVWPEFFPGYEKPTSVEARRIMKAGIGDVEEVLEFVAHAAEYQHRGRGVTIGEGEKARTTREELDNPVAYVIRTIKNELKAERNAEPLSTAAKQLQPSGSNVQVHEVKSAVPSQPQRYVPALPAPHSNGHEPANVGKQPLKVEATAGTRPMFDDSPAGSNSHTSQPKPDNHYPF